MPAAVLTRTFFENGGRIFAGDQSLLASQVRVLGLASLVTLASAGAISHGSKPLQVDTERLQQGIQAVKNIENTIAQVVAKARAGIEGRLTPPAAPAAVDLSASEEIIEDETAIKSVNRLMASRFVEGAQSDTVFHEFGDFKISHAMVKDIVRAAHDSGFPVSYLFGVAEKESGFDPDAKAPKGSALGLMQFIEQTWFRVVKDHGARFGLEKESSEIELATNKHGKAVYTIRDREERQRVLDLRRDPYLSAVLAATDLKSAKAQIEANLGRRFSDANLYLPHFLGADQAEVAMAALGSKPAAAAHKVFQREASFNPGMFYEKSRGSRRPVSMATFVKRSQDVILKRAEKYADVETLAATPVTAFIESIPPVPVARPGVVHSFTAQLNARIANRMPFVAAFPPSVIVDEPMSVSSAKPEFETVLAMKL